MYKKVRGIIVSSNPMGEVHSRIGLYTEEGLLYVTVYGGRSAKGKMRGNDSLFIMGNFHLEQNKKNFYKLYDIKVHENCFSLSNHLKSYYIVCVACDLVRFLSGTHHHEQFKNLIDLVLYLVNVCKSIKASVSPDILAPVCMCVFLWRSFVCNGWQPQRVESSALDTEKGWSLQMPAGEFVPRGQGVPNEGAMDFGIIKKLQDSYSSSFSQTVENVGAYCSIHADIGTNMANMAMQHLVYAWQHILERKIWSAHFLL